MPTHTYSTDAHRRSVAKYTSAHRTVKTLGLYDTTDADIIAHLATKDNVQGYIKALIRADMARNEQEEYRMMSKPNYAAKEKIVRAGASKVFKSWNENAGVTMEEFLDGLKWICEDPMPEGRMTRELGCVRRAETGWDEKSKAIIGEFEPHSPGVDGLHRLTRIYDKKLDTILLYDENGMLWGGSTEYASINASDHI